LRIIDKSEILYICKKAAGGFMKKICSLLTVFIVIFMVCGSNKKNDNHPTGPQIELEQGQVTDVDGNVYKTVKIGNQWWMAENLRVTKDPDGNSITSYVYDNNESMALTYGRLYTWQVMMNGSSNPGSRGIAPDGWHIPSIDEWQILTDYLGRDEVAGGKMKEQGTEHWDLPNADATNSSGLTLVASGSYVVSQNRYCDLKGGAHILTSSSDWDLGVFIAVDKNSGNIGNATIPKTDIAFSVRCVKN